MAESPLPAAFAACPQLGDAALAVVLEPTDNTIQLGCVGNLNATLRFRGRVRTPPARGPATTRSRGPWWAWPSSSRRAPHRDDRRAGVHRGRQHHADPWRRGRQRDPGPGRVPCELPVYARPEPRPRPRPRSGSSSASPESSRSPASRRRGAWRPGPRLLERLIAGWRICGRPQAGLDAGRAVHRDRHRRRQPRPRGDRDGPHARGADCRRRAGAHLRRAGEVRAARTAPHDRHRGRSDLTGAARGRDVSVCAPRRGQAQRAGPRRGTDRLRCRRPARADGRGDPPGAGRRGPRNDGVPQGRRAAGAAQRHRRVGRAPLRRDARSGSRRSSRPSAPRRPSSASRRSSSIRRPARTWSRSPSRAIPCPGRGARFAGAQVLSLPLTHAQRIPAGPGCRPARRPGRGSRCSG